MFARQNRVSTIPAYQVAMTVRCEGDHGPMEQAWEKQDFECELTHRGLRHEDFVLHVRRRSSGGSLPWNHDYSVTVEDRRTGREHVYIGGPAHHWVSRFAADLAKRQFAAMATACPTRSSAYPAR
jgi:hypothetical protein